MKTLNQRQQGGLSPKLREVQFEAIANVRDLGGMPTPNGWTQRGVLFRSATMHRANTRDAEFLDLLGIDTVIDLRSAEERRRWNGYGAWTPRLVVQAPLLRTPWSAEQLARSCSPDAFLAARYVEMFQESTHVMRELIQTIAEAPGPIVFHCAAGKDRTGVLAAVVLGLAGVDDEVIADDYHHTATAMDEVKACFATDVDVTTMVNQPSAFLEAPREAMVLALTMFRSIWPTFEEYAAEIGVLRPTLAKLQRRIVGEPARPMLGAVGV